MQEQQNKQEKYSRLLGQQWYESLKDLINSQYWDMVGEYISSERKIHTVYPIQGSDLLFKAFRTTPISQVKVVILGQDPYHDGSYDGFAFSNKGKESKLSPSLRNIFKEINDTVKPECLSDNPSDPDLERWAKQGVLLINTAHTVRKGMAGVHAELWKPFTEKVITTLLEFQNYKVEHPHIAWMLWGSHAFQTFKKSYEKAKIEGDHLILHSAHPSPFSAYQGFFGSNHFNKANEFLIQHDSEPIIW